MTSAGNFMDDFPDWSPDGSKDPFVKLPAWSRAALYRAALYNINDDGTDGTKIA